MHLIVVRHGQPHNETRESGHGDPALTELGLAQAQAVCKFLTNETIDHIVASPMVRARQTGEPLAEMLGMEIEFDDDLKEAGWNAGPYLRTEENMGGFVDKIKENPDWFYLPEGRAAFQERIHRSFNRIAAENAGRNVAVFCHGMVMGSLVASTFGGDPVDDELHANYTAISRIQSSSDSKLRRLVSFNETQHLSGLT